MGLKSLICFLVLCLATPSIIHAKTPGKKKDKPNFKLIEAYSQRTLPGIPGVPIKTDYHFILVWEGTKYPETFFWRGENGWLPCKIEKAHKIVKKDHHVPDGLDYRTEQAGGDIHKGDTLELTPLAGGKFPIPPEIPKEAKNTLFFKTGGGGWLAFPVKDIVKKHDIAMP